MILNLDTSDRGSSPSLALICEFFVVIFLFICFLLLLFLVLGHGLITHALLSTSLHVRRLASICKSNQ